MTYAELDAASDGLACRLRDHDIERGEYVGLVQDRTIGSVVGVLGILKAGCAYVPFDPAYPARRLHYVANDCRVRLAVGDQTAARAGGLTNLTFIAPESMGSGPIARSAKISEDDTAYVIHTSGTTGSPKGCLITHGNVLALMKNALPLFDVGPDDRWTLFHSFSFDFSVWELWGALLSGATAICVPQDSVRESDKLLSLIEREGITILNQVPSAFRALERMYKPTAWPSLGLRYVIFGGECIDMHSIRSFLSKVPPPSPRMVNMYGITETTVHATFKLLEGSDYYGPVRSPIGRPLPHVTVTIRDDNERSVAPGQAGEVYIAGEGVSSGYLDRPALTAQRFRKLSTDSGTRVFYRTGDLARWTPSGELEYLGRNDQQVKVRGFRLELGEVEAALRDHEYVADAAALVTTRRTGGEMLVACVVPKPEFQKQLLPQELRTYLMDMLPPYMVPQRFKLVGDLPLTASGKLDRAAVRAMVSE